MYVRGMKILSNQLGLYSLNENEFGQYLFVNMQRNLTFADLIFCAQWLNLDYRIVYSDEFDSYIKEQFLNIFQFEMW